MSSNTSIGGQYRGGNENHDGDPRNKTLGESAPANELPAGADESITQDAGAEVPAGVPGARPRPGIAKGPQSYPDGPNVEDSPWELEAARGNVPKER